MSVDYAKLKTNLNLIMHRLKLVEKKKVELNQKARRTIGEFLNAGKVDRARIRVEQIIREDYLIEALDLIESYCDFLLSRYGQLKASEVVDEGLAAAVSSLIWVAPYFENDVNELKIIADQLGRKYGKQFVQNVKENQLKTVNEVLMKKMGMQVPPKVLVEKYLVEIAKDQKIDYKPDPRILKEQEAAFNASGFRPGNSSDEEEDDLRAPQHHHQPGEAPQSGFNLIDLGDHYPRNPITQPFNPYDQPPPLPSEPPLGGNTQHLRPFDSLTDTTDASAPSAQLPIGFNLPGLNESLGSSSGQSTSAPSSTSSKKKEQQKQKGGGSDTALSSGQDAGGPPPHYDTVVNKPGNTTQYHSFGPDSSFGPQHKSRDDLNDTLPELPPVPKDTNDDASSQDDFEDLTRRFEELKNKKK